MSRSAFEKQLRSDELAGGVIRLAAVYESRLDTLLTYYFAREEVAPAFYELVVARMSLFQKLDLLKSIPLGTGTRSRENLISTLSSLRKLRNALAHNWNILPDEAAKLYADAVVRRVVLGYPSSLSDEKRNMETRITKLFNVLLRGTRT